MPQADWISAEDARDRLGVRAQTLYAYVSRGRVQVRPDPGDSRRSLYRAADICVFPSRYEPLGNVVIQSWAHGLPVIAAASQGPAALIRDGEDGLLVPVDEAQALAEAIGRLIADPMLCIRLVQNGAERVEAQFSPAAVVAQWRRLFADYGAV